MYELITSTELEDPVHGLQKAKPVWITVEDTRGESVNKNGKKRGRGGEETRVVVVADDKHDVHNHNHYKHKKSCSAAAASSNVQQQGTGEKLILARVDHNKIPPPCSHHENKIARTPHEEDQVLFHMFKEEDIPHRLEESVISL
jgi:hypothetical protein